MQPQARTFTKGYFHCKMFWKTHKKCLDLTQHYAYLTDIIKLKHLFSVIICQKEAISLLSTLHTSEATRITLSSRFILVMLSVQIS